MTNFLELPIGEVPRIHLLGTRVNRASNPSRGRLFERHPPKLGVNAQFPQTEPQAPLDGAPPQAEALGHLGLRHAPKVQERQDLLALLVLILSWWWG